jgi:protein TilB
VSYAVTVELIRKRAEHNEGEIHSLEELTLHQEKLEKIELVDRICKQLKILMLQNNAISKIGTELFGDRRR